MSYFREFGMNWPTLLGATIGVALGSALNHYLTSLFAPALIGEFGWDRANFALVGTLGLASMFVVPFWGRFIDRHGVRVPAAIGYSVIPLTFLAFSLMSGSIHQFFAIAIVQHLFGVLTTTLVFSRAIVERFHEARGLALSVLMTGPPLIGATIIPVLSKVIETEGWRTGYQVLALISAIGGLAAIALVGSGKKSGAAPGRLAPRRLTRAELVDLFHNRSFLLIVGGMFLVNVPTVIVSSQLNLVLIENGVAAGLVAWIVSLYATGVIIGRFISGLALDRLRPQTVALASLGLPAIGFAILASPSELPWLIAGAVLLIGLAQGAEGDIGAYLTSRTFSLTQYSFVYSFLIASMSLATALGSVLLSLTLRSSENFDLFLIVSAAVTVVGALCFFMTGRSGGASQGDPGLATIAVGGESRSG